MITSFYIYHKPNSFWLNLPGTLASPRAEAMPVDSAEAETSALPKGEEMEQSGPRYGNLWMIYGNF